MVYVMKIIKQEIQFEESLKQRLEFICEFSKVNPTFIKGSIRKIEKTNLSYIEPHKVIVKDITLLVLDLGQVFRHIFLRIYIYFSSFACELL